ncbi:SRPBCC family protein [Parendozoicomonas sp. Alg238-R29]|uniref:SRPBCC family protein n=1 Tax=Parendozoicomonas sp. Alg238-R29 TaxID=2993446 RepID=UPI00248E373A|nr:SRPBCC family protein [Parendozoicomonas sp. Alg238-R29]
MAIIKHIVEIACTPQELFEYLTQPWLWHEWHPNSVSATNQGTPLRVGDEYSEIYKIRLFKSLPIMLTKHLHYEVLEVEPFSSWKVRAHTVGAVINFHYQFEPCEKGVRYTRNLDYQVRGLFRVGAPLLEKRNREMSDVAVENIVRIMEQRSILTVKQRQAATEQAG